MASCIAQLPPRSSSSISSLCAQDKSFHQLWLSLIQIRRGSPAACEPRKGRVAAPDEQLITGNSLQLREKNSNLSVMHETPALGACIDVSSRYILFVSLTESLCRDLLGVNETIYNAWR
jgi:hypothetical protein